MGDTDEFLFQKEVIGPMVTMGCNVIVSQVEKRAGKPLVLGVSVLGKATLGEAVALTAAKGFAKGVTTNWLIVGDVVQFGTGQLVAYAGGGRIAATVMSSLSGLATNTAIGFMTTGPFGAAGGAAVWGVGLVASMTYSLFKRS